MDRFIGWMIVVTATFTAVGRVAHGDAFAAGPYAFIALAVLFGVKPLLRGTPAASCSCGPRCHERIDESC